MKLRNWVVFLLIGNSRILFAENSIEVLGNPGTLAILSSGGLYPVFVVDSSTTWGYNVDSAGIGVLGELVTVQISENMPTNTQLFIQLAAPLRGVSSGYVSLSTIANTVVSDIPIPSSQNDLEIDYKFQLNALAQAASFSVTATFTLMDM